MMSTAEEQAVMDSLKSLGLHETLTLDHQTEVRRVPRGFLYVTTVRTVTNGTAVLSSSVASTFVPCNFDRS